MPTTQQLRSRLVNKLKELFQLNQPDLDFGFYRIMHAKAEQVTRFLENDLLAIIADAFGEVDESRKTQLKAEYEKEVETAKEYGASDPETVPKVAEARERYETAQDTATAEGEIYDHLYRFFERYYDNGDFISRRYYTRETPGKAAPFAVPYNGEEVKLHWANADQYYIKTAEHFQNYTVDLRQAKEIRERREKEELFEPRMDANGRESMKVHFRVVDAAEGEHGNVKASEATKRYFIIHKEEPVLIDESGELIIQFEYRPDPEKSGQENTWRDKRNAEAVEVILEALKNHESTRIDTNEKKTNSRSFVSISGSEYLRLLTVPAPTDKDAKRPLLAKYINQYTARNTMDYFIHKDLGAFLRRELDFYIKNEVMRLEDIESAEAPAVETYLSKLKVLRTIAHKLIDFLAQLENFQKRLWLKKKFVVETNYCITLDRIPEELYPEIAANDAQREEWVRLFAIDQIEASTVGPAYSEPLTVEFLKANAGLVVDTAFFPDSFVDRLLSGINDVSVHTTGLLLHSENFQAIRLLGVAFRSQFKCIYIDPPYNSKYSEIAYKNAYKHSSWACLYANRLREALTLLSADGVWVTAIDENELNTVAAIQPTVFPDTWKTVCVSVIHNPGGIQGRNFSNTNDFSFFSFDDSQKTIGPDVRGDSEIEPLRDWGGEESKRNTAANCFYPIFVKKAKIIGFGEVCDDNDHPASANVSREDGVVEVYPIDANGVERKWRFARQSVEAIQEELLVQTVNGEYVIKRAKTIFRQKTVWLDSKYNANAYGSKILNSIIPASPFKYPKSLYTVLDSIRAGTWNSNSNPPTIFDYFAGSGTTAHAAIELSRTEQQLTKYVLAEMGDYFDTVLKPRIQKVIYSKDWKDGKPVDPSTGISHCFKYIRLESYEDCLNNLVFPGAETRDRTLERNDDLREDYMLHYMLDVETRGSQSLLNIDAFADPIAYKLRVKKPGSDQYVTRNVDLIETFNYLIGLRVMHIAAPQEFTATFKRETDPELPENTQTRLVVDGRLTQDENGPWCFRKVEGWVPADPNNPNNGERQKVLIVWRKLTGKIEEDNLMLDEWFQRNRISTRDFEFDVIYVNGSNNLPNLKQEGDNWKVRLIEEDFMRLMWDVEDV